MIANIKTTLFTLIIGSVMYLTAFPTLADSNRFDREDKQKPSWRMQKSARDDNGSTNRFKKNKNARSDNDDDDLDRRKRFGNNQSDKSDREKPYSKKQRRDDDRPRDQKQDGNWGQW